MGFETLPENVEKFFNSGGELQDGMVADPPPIDPPAAADPPAADTVPVDPVPADPPEVVYKTDPHVEELLNERTRQLNELTGKLNELTGKLTKTPEPVVPDPETDPLGFLTHQLKTLHEEVKELKNHGVKKDEQSEQQQQVQAFQNSVNADIKGFKEKNPDYEDAYKHLIKTRREDYATLGLSEKEMTDRIGREELDIAVTALQKGKSPAEVVYGLAKRYGYKPAAPVAEDAGTKLERIKKGHEASKTVERSGNPPPVSLDAAKSAGDRDLTDMVANHWDELMGRNSSVI